METLCKSIGVVTRSDSICLEIYMKKLPPLPRLKKKLWRLFSEYIRKRDADEDGMVKCFTCVRQMHWKEAQAGHYTPQSIALSLVFHEKNVHAQCAPCNLYKRGNQTVYAIELQKRYGPTILEDLQNERVENFRYTRVDYMELIEKYQGLLKNPATKEEIIMDIDMKKLSLDTE